MPGKPICNEYCHIMIMWKDNKLLERTKKLILLGGIILAPLLAQGQIPRITLRIDSIPFVNFVDTLEKVTDYRFFYNGSWSDSLIIRVHAVHEPVSRVLSGVFKNTGIYCLITGKKVIFSQGVPFKTSFKKNMLFYLRLQQKQKEKIRYALSSNRENTETLSRGKYKLYKIGNPADFNKGKYAFLSGTVKDGNTGLPAPGVVVYFPALKKGTTTDEKGHYSLWLPKGQHAVEYRLIGMHIEKRNLILFSDGRFDIEIFEQVNQLGEVTVSANRENQVRNLRIGIEKISVKMLKQIPMGLGEVDLVKSSLLLPGVQSVGEAAAGYNIRGGSTDQNLILLNGAPVMNSSHFFGFFSAFNSDMIEDVTLYKSGVPARYGGRVSSVMDIKLKQGNTEKIKCSGGISPVTGRIMVEGPVTKKANFVLGTRSTYSDWILKQLKDKQLQMSTARFQDLQGILNVEAGKGDHLSLFGYMSRDLFNYYKESAFEYTNQAVTLRWTHTFSPRLYADISAILSNYEYRVDNIQDTLAMSSLFYRINQKIAKADFAWLFSEVHKVTFGVSSTGYSLFPGKQLPLNDLSDIMPHTLEEEKALENSLYISDEYKISSLITLSGGIRMNMFMALGPATEYHYREQAPLAVEIMTDTAYYGKNKIKAFYPGLGYRFTSRFLISPGLSVKAGLQRMYQYLHMMSNTTAISPTDIWTLSDRYIKPVTSDQVSLGIYKNFQRNKLEISAEAYYKFLGNILDYKNGARLLMNDHLETDVLNGKGKAYGVELMIKKQTGNITGWISYAYARILHKIDGDFAVEKVNNGKWFPADYDKPHDVKLVINTKLSRRFNVTANFMYSTGRPITYPVGYFRFGDVNRIFYSDRNEFRIPDYMRLDLAATLNGNLKMKKLNHSSFTLAVYNVLGRRNPYSIYFKLEDGEMNGYKLSIFGQPIITLTYNFRIFGNALGDF